VADLPPGARVLVPFGQQTLVGVLLGISKEGQIDASRLKPAKAVLDNESCLGEELLALTAWAATYYQHPVGEAMATALPTLLRQGEAASLDGETVWELSTEGKGLPEGALKRAPRQAELLAALQQRGQLDRQALRALDFGSDTLRQLEKKGLIHCRQIRPQPAAINADELYGEAPLTLNAEQQAALDQLRYQGFASYLLEGATGSGKTEVYLQAIARVLEQGRSALVL